MEIRDITVAVRPGMPVYPGDPPVVIERLGSLAEGDLANLSKIEFGLHTETHVDAPVHFIDGAAGVEALPLDALVGPAVVADARGIVGDIDEAALAALGIPEGTERLLLRTGNSQLWDLPAFSAEFVGITVDAARALVRRGVRLVGIDYLSIAPADEPAATHVALLSAGIVILEGIDLRSVEPGAYTLLCLPLKVAGADGAPARAILTRR